MPTPNPIAESYPYDNGAIRCAGVSLAELAQRYGTPLYVYAAEEIRRRYAKVVAGLSSLVSKAGEAPLICYSVKANSNTHVLRLLAKQGSGFDIVSQGELVRALEAGGEAGKIVFAGVGKTDEEIRFALQRKVGLFNVESIGELARIETIAAELQLPDGSVSVALRLNPDIDPETHSYISTGKEENKFGIDMKTAVAAVAAWKFKKVSLSGVHLHIGSQIRKADRYAAALGVVVSAAKQWKAAGHKMNRLNLGGGFGVDYQRGAAADFDLSTYASAIRGLWEELGQPRLVVEPGRYIIAPSCVMLTKVIDVKPRTRRTFYVVDAGMNDLIRPSLYGAYHAVWPTLGHGVPQPVETVPPQDPHAHGHDDMPAGKRVSDIVGPVCESGDFLGLGRDLPELKVGELLTVFHAGAYGMTMASNYNSRPRPAEVLVEHDGTHRLIRRRETYDDLLQTERGL